MLLKDLWTWQVFKEGDEAEATKRRKAEKKKKEKSPWGGAVVKKEGVRGAAKSRLSELRKLRTPENESFIPRVPKGILRLYNRISGCGKGAGDEGRDTSKLYL